MAQPTWVLGFSDEVWWSRLAQPDQHCWTEAEAKHKLQELTPPTDDPDPKALTCYGLLRRPEPPQAEQIWLRFVTGRPVSAVTIATSNPRLFMSRLPHPDVCVSAIWRSSLRVV